MKVESDKITPPAVFAPVELKITFESEEELSKFYAMFNHGYILGAVNGSHKFDKNAEAIRDSLARQYPKVLETYSEPFQRLSKCARFVNWS